MTRTGHVRLTRRHRTVRRTGVLRSLPWVRGTGTGHGHAGHRHRWRLALAFALVVPSSFVELAAGLWSGSLALLSDAGHMAADVVALGAALAATRIATRPDTTGRRTYGSYRAEVFASGFTVLLMLGTAAYVAVEAVRRLGPTSSPPPAPMLVVGGLGLLVNLVALLLLRGGATESLAVKGAYLEVIADSLGSVGVMAAALLGHGHRTGLVGHGRRRVHRPLRRGPGRRARP